MAGLPFDAGDWQALVGCSGLEGLVGLGVWWRLMDQSGVRFATVVLGEVSGSEAELVVPRSRHATVVVVDSLPWASFLAGRPMAWCPQAHLLMLGPPTEDAWEEFEAACR